MRTVRKKRPTSPPDRRWKQDLNGGPLRASFRSGQDLARELCGWSPVFPSFHPACAILSMGIGLLPHGGLAVPACFECLLRPAYTFPTAFCCRQERGVARMGMTAGEA